LEWQTVRALRYRQHKPDGKLVEATWLTDFSSRQLSSLSLYHMAKSRWEIENQTFNDAKNRYGFEHTCHHEKNSVLLNYLITLLALTMSGSIVFVTCIAARMRCAPPSSCVAFSGFRWRVPSRPTPASRLLPAEPRPPNQTTTCRTTPSLSRSGTASPTNRPVSIGTCLTALACIPAGVRECQ